MEKTHQIPGYEYYTITESGSIHSSLRDKTVKQHTNGDYKMVFLMMPMFNGYSKKGKWEYVHRIMGKIFLPPPKDNQIWINHIDGNKSNNSIENLEWSTIAENIQHYWDNLSGNRRKKLIVNQ